MTGESVEQLALGLVSCEISDQSTFGGVFPELFDLRQIVLHRRRPALELQRQKVHPKNGPSARFCAEAIQVFPFFKLPDGVVGPDLAYRYNREKVATSVQ